MTFKVIFQSIYFYREEQSKIFFKFKLTSVSSLKSLEIFALSIEKVDFKKLMVAPKKHSLPSVDVRSIHDKLKNSLHTESKNGPLIEKLLAFLINFLGPKRH
jgi:hypothetical protein